jgi:hypothetical protein
LVESSPLTSTTTGAAASEALLKYAGRVVPSYGISTRVTPGSKPFSCNASTRR